MIDIWKKRTSSRLHIWFDAKPSSSTCDLGDRDCLVQLSEPRVRCACCHLVLHEVCLQCRENLIHQCKETFTSVNEFNVNDSIEPNKHQFEFRLVSKGKCHLCKKNFKSFAGRKVPIFMCLWCKITVHSSRCFSEDMRDDPCSVPPFVLPHTCIFKKKSISPQRNNFFKSNNYLIRHSDDHRHPIVLFINKKSGGGQFERLYKQALWLLNPRQIFDLSLSGPHFGLQLFKDVRNVLFVVAGGDGTVGWILSAATELKMVESLKLGIIPLGTGNDLARSFNWGPGYTTEPLSNILDDILCSSLSKLDRWSVLCSPLPTRPLPINIMHNYFSVGADARIALEFHQSRNANPEKFNSRFWNKLFYAGMGGKDIIMQSCKDLSEFCSLKCDDVDLTKKLQEKKISTLLFLNIGSYAGGRNPWGNPSSQSYLPQSCSDGWLEVIGLTYVSLLSTQLGGTGCRLCQCRKADVWLKKDLPVQVDGEPSLLSAGDISISHFGQANILQRKSHRSNSPGIKRTNSSLLNIPNFDPFSEDSPLSNEVVAKRSYPVYLVSGPCVLEKMTEFNKQKLRYWGVISMCPNSTIDSARQLIKQKEAGQVPREMPISWKFAKIDSVNGCKLSKPKDEKMSMVSEWLTGGALHIFT